MYIVACNVELLLARSSVVIAVGDAGTDPVTNKPHENNPGGQRHENGKYHCYYDSMKYCGKFFFTICIITFCAFQYSVKYIHL